MRIYLIALLIFGFITWWQWKKLPEGIERRRYVQKLIMWGLLGVIFLLAATGRIHWLGAAFAALLPILKVFFTWVLRFSPALAKIYTNRTNTNTAMPANVSNKMELAEAREVLGISEGATKDEVQMAYKRQMQKVHPDRGGSEYFAIKLNEARDLLLKELNS